MFENVFILFIHFSHSYLDFADAGGKRFNSVLSQEETEIICILFIHIFMFFFYQYPDVSHFFSRLLSGNVFVIAAILLEKNLQSVANYLILSLAVADLLVACLVMPLSAVYEISREWKLGPELCDMWTSSDVLCCTASILHLVAIALDR